MSKEVKKQETEAPKSNKKYVALAFVVILAIIGIMMNNDSEEETIATSTVATTEQVPVTEETSATEASSTEETTSTIARIDITTPLVNADEPQFEVYVDDSDVPLKQQRWMPKFGRQGYVAQKDGNSMDITIKTLNDSELKITLRGQDRRDENNKIMENWVDYTSVQINGEEILPETTAVWHNKPFVYKINAKASDKIKVSAKWQKHNEE